MIASGASGSCRHWSRARKAALAADRCATSSPTRNPPSAMAKFELTAAADRDLADIYIYSHAQFGERQADDYLIGLESCFARLAEMTDLGRSIEHIRAGYYRFSHARHVIFYNK